MFEDLLYNIMAAIRTYCKHDIILIQKLLLMFSYLKKQEPEDSSYSKFIDAEAKNLMEDAKNAISNEVDLKKAANLAASFNLTV